MLDVKLAKEIKNEKEAVLLGGKIWESGSMRRVYFNGNTKYELIGANITLRKTGSVDCCEINGEGISNKKAREVVYAKLYFDCNTNEVVYQSGTEKKVIFSVK